MPAIAHRDLHESTSQTRTALAYTHDLESSFRVEVGSLAPTAWLSLLPHREGDHRKMWWLGLSLALGAMKSWDRWIHCGYY
jgi:hypothetical protein